MPVGVPRRRLAKERVIPCSGHEVGPTTNGRVLHRRLPARIQLDPRAQPAMELPPPGNPARSQCLARPRCPRACRCSFPVRHPRSPGRCGTPARPPASLPAGQTSARCGCARFQRNVRQSHHPSIHRPARPSHGSSRFLKSSTVHQARRKAYCATIATPIRNSRHSPLRRASVAAFLPSSQLYPHLPRSKFSDHDRLCTRP